MNHVRDVLPEKWKRDEGLNVYYHYVLVLLIEGEERLQIPKWKHILIDSKNRHDMASGQLTTVRHVCTHARAIQTTIERLG
jgi:hypothetical protein